MISRLGVYGGMFDPVHKGHIHAACHVRDLLGLELVKLIPCKQPNHRENALASSGDRVAMLELAIADEGALEVDTCELEREGVSYAVETLEYLRGKYGAAQLVFILGMDSFNSLTAWHRWESLQDLCHLLVLSRQGEKPDSQLAETLYLDDRKVEQPAQLFSKPSGNIYIDTGFAHHASSSQVRRGLIEEESIEDLLDSNVFNFIVEHGLYGSNNLGEASGNLSHGQ